jgi:pyruvate,water dikinase
MRAESELERATRRAAVAELGDPRTRDPAFSGAKAASLARAASAGFPVLPGYVVATWADLERDRPDVERAWARLGAGGRQLIVRSSSTVEDAERSSMAGRFRSVGGVSGWPSFIEAVDLVRASASDERGSEAPMAVLVQPMLDAVRGGVAFGVDPVTGDRRRFVVECVAGSPKRLVDGVETATHVAVRRSGLRLRRPGRGRGAERLTRRDLFRIAGLTRRAERVFGFPQDIEWAIDAAGHLWLLQSRPVTAIGQVATRGPVLGPGPIAETFPEPLSPLEEELFLEPLRDGIVGALRAIGAVVSSRIAASPVALTVGGRVAADLELLGVAPRHHTVLRAIDPRRGARRLAAAWHTGRLRLAMPQVTRDLLRWTDAWLASVPALSSLDEGALVALLDEAVERLRGLHGHQVLAGMLVPAEEHGPGASALAIDAIAAGRAAGMRDEEIVARTPSTLAVVPPAVGEVTALPAAAVRTSTSPPCSQASVSSLGPREALRLRARWVDELTARATWVLAHRLERAGRLRSAGDVRFLSRQELAEMVRGGPAPADLDVRAGAAPGPPLPASFRLAADGTVVPELEGRSDAAGVAAGGGRGAGVVRHVACAGPGAVLVVDVLAPSLAPRLPGLAGLVSETGSTLSHLAILARELNVPTVVAVPGAIERFPVGSRVVVDGLTGEVTVEGEGASS